MLSMILIIAAPLSDVLALPLIPEGSSSTCFLGCLFQRCLGIELPPDLLSEERLLLPLTLSDLVDILSLEVEGLKLGLEGC